MNSTLQRGEFRDIERALIREILEAKPVNRGTWHAQKAPAPTRELRHVRLIMPVPMLKNSLVRKVNPNMPWAEQQFQERVSGVPLNPPPSHASWPFAEKSNGRHVDENGQFSHTYPERYWPKLAGRPLDSTGGHFGIRYEYGDLKDLVDILRNDPTTRQAVLPVWFPEDLTAAKDGQRVPCSLFYHFLSDGEGHLDIVYSIRSCDFLRHFRDDVYMTCRLLQYVVYFMNFKGEDMSSMMTPRSG
jgi:thymidylate synthase